MRDPSPATYRHSTIPDQPKTTRQKESRETVSLTPAETRVLILLPSYRTLAAIGNQLGIGRPTVKTHVENIYTKLGATKRAEAVKRAERAGLLPRPVTEGPQQGGHRPTHREDARPRHLQETRMTYHDGSR